MILRFRAYSRSNRDIDEVLQSGALIGHKVNEPIIILGDTITDSQYKLREVYMELRPHIVEEISRTSDSFSIEVTEEDGYKLKNKYGFKPAEQTMKIAHREVSMKDIFNYPEKIRELKEYEKLRESVYSDIMHRLNDGIEPKVLLVSHRLYRLIQSSGDFGVYVPLTHSNDITENGTETYMGLTIAIPAGYASKDHCKVV